MSGLSVSSWIIRFHALNDVAVHLSGNVWNMHGSGINATPVPLIYVDDVLKVDTVDYTLDTAQGHISFLITVDPATEVVKATYDYDVAVTGEKPGARPLKTVVVTAEVATVSGNPLIYDVLGENIQSGETVYLNAVLQVGGYTITNDQIVFALDPAPAVVTIDYTWIRPALIGETPSWQLGKPMTCQAFEPDNEGNIQATLDANGNTVIILPANKPDPNSVINFQSRTEAFWEHFNQAFKVDWLFDIIMANTESDNPVLFQSDLNEITNAIQTSYPKPDLRIGRRHPLFDFSLRISFKRSA